LKGVPFRLAVCTLLLGESSTSAQFCPADGTPWPNGAAPFRANTCDLNLDGRPDIVAANADTDNLSVHLNLPGGGFSEAQVFAAGDEPVDVDCCDVDGDGDVDIVTANRSTSKVNILLNNGVANWILQLGAPTPYAVGLAPWGVRCIQLNADTRPDLVTSNFTGTSVSILLNNGNGTFAPHEDLPTGGTGTYYIATCDLDGDLDDDVMVSNMTGQTITSFRNQGDGTLVKIGTYSVGTLVFPWGITCSDVNGDGHLDAVTANGGDNTISVLRNDGAGHFDGSLPAVFEGPGQPFGITCCDLDGDLDLDVLTANLSSDDVSVMTNAGDGSFALTRSLPVGTNVGSVQCEDLDRDGDVDVLASSGNNVMIFESACLFGDADGDGKVDLFDFAEWPACMTGPIPATLSFPCGAFDQNDDGSVDLADWTAFQNTYCPT
jgi:hypothetical protein